MRTYIVYFIDKTIEYVNAYNYEIHSGTAMFDVGHGKHLHLFGVERVEVDE